MVLIDRRIRSTRHTVGMASFREIRAMSDDEIVEHHDVNHKNVNWGQRDWQQEMARRDAVRQGDRIEAMTRTMRNLTWAIAAMTFASLLTAVVAVYLASKAG